MWEHSDHIFYTICIIQKILALSNSVERCADELMLLKNVPYSGGRKLLLFCSCCSWWFNPPLKRCH
jgi:hypothetical protein